MTDCPNAEIRDQLPDLVHGRLTAAEREGVEAHLAVCDLCAEELALLRALHGATSSGRRVNVARIVASLPSHAATRARSRGHAWRRRGVAAALAVAAGLSAVMLSRDAGPKKDTDSIAVVDHRTTGSPTPSIPDSIGDPSANVSPSLPPSGRRSVAAGPVDELAVGGELADLSDGGLASLLAEIETLDAMPAGDPDEALPSAERIGEDG